MSQSFSADLVEVARPPDRPDLIGVVEEADAGLSQAVTLPDRLYAEARDEPPPNVCAETTSCCQPNTVSSFLWNLERKKNLHFKVLLNYFMK